MEVTGGKEAWATSAGHWYTQAGAPAYTVIGKNGKERPTTLRDARQSGLVPSVTTIIRQAASPGLERWKAEQVLMAALTLARKPDEPEAAWISRVWDDSREQAAKAAERGTAIHGAIERHFRGEPVPEELQPFVDGALKAIATLNLSAITPERSFAHPFGYGGKIDLAAPEAILDFKGKDGDLSDVRLYDEHLMQLGAYRHGLGSGAPVGIVFVSRTIPGIARLMMVEPPEAERGFRMFSALLNFWQAKNDYHPAFKREAVAS